MAAKNFLPESERNEIIERYKADKLNNPPANISDKTLIENYGTDEQKARLQESPATEEQEADKNKASNEEPTPEELAQAEKEAKELEYQRGLYFDTHGKDAAEDMTIGELIAINSTNNKDAENNTIVTNIPDYIKEFGRYTELHNKMPDQSLTAEQLKEANDKRAEVLVNEKAQAEQIKQNMKAAGNASNKNNVTLVNHSTKEKIVVTRFTYDKFIKKNQPEWRLMPEAPQEVQDALEIKPPVESIGK